MSVLIVGMGRASNSVHREEGDEYVSKGDFKDFDTFFDKENSFVNLN